MFRNNNFLACREKGKNNYVYVCVCVYGDKSGPDPASFNHTKYPYSCCCPGKQVRMVIVSEDPPSGTSCRISLLFPAKAGTRLHFFYCTA